MLNVYMHRVENHLYEKSGSWCFKWDITLTFSHCWTWLLNVNIFFFVLHHYVFLQEISQVTVTNFNLFKHGSNDTSLLDRKLGGTPRSQTLRLPLLPVVRVVTNGWGTAFSSSRTLKHPIKKRVTLVPTLLKTGISKSHWCGYRCITQLAEPGCGKRQNKKSRRAPHQHWFWQLLVSPKARVVFWRWTSGTFGFLVLVTKVSQNNGRVSTTVDGIRTS
jgi:hypothetical protein